jgi:hypothetical protein
MKSACVFAAPVVQVEPPLMWQPTTWLSKRVTSAVPERAVHDVQVPLSDSWVRVARYNWSAPGAEPPRPMAVGGKTLPLPLRGVAVMPGLLSPSASGKVVPVGKVQDEVGQAYVDASVDEGSARPMSASVGAMVNVLGGPQPVSDPVEA